ncbi:polysaccharide pyruvyl transferase family protein [Dyadobacter sp. CY323]|uniref:polysaccharide pyruvyl transferase family protein n=1 Tax=Dyadobacter sp. CY323 TaxID=2907302 RepID=UPI001F1DED9A|nr:polysaccharide pyruvyl transferase family protein [Dyadobacter sp. CY323]MCE6992751.1 polysaccharide pyruvyl transferase family protein [Dyadobacter sp. CY323]
MVTPKRLVFFQANTQYENTGDVLINKSLLDHLKHYANIVVNDAGMPVWYVDELGVGQSERISNIGKSFKGYLISAALRGFFFRKTLKIYLIAGPPGHQSGNSKSKAVRNIISGFFFCFLQLLGVKIIKVGFSLGSIGNYIAFAEKFRSLFTNFYYIRDSISLKLAKDIGIKKAVFFPDLAWTYHPVMSAVNSTVTYPKNKILITFRDAVGKGDYNDTYLHKIDRILDATLNKYQHKYEFVVVYQVQMDYDFCKKLYDKLSERYPISFVEDQITLGSAQEFYSDVICMLTNRLHGALLAYKYGALPVILTDIDKHTKIKGIYEDAGLSDLMANTNDNSEKILAGLSDLLENKSMVYKKIQKVEKEYIELSNILVNKIFQ